MVKYHIVSRTGIVVYTTSNEETAYSIAKSSDTIYKVIHEYARPVRVQ